MVNTLPQFVDADAKQILDDTISYFQNLSGKTLLPAQVERLVLQTFAHREKLIRDGINDAGRQSLMAFSRAPLLDYVVQLNGVSRLSARSASVPVDFAIVTGHTGVTIPANTRVQSSDGKATFAVAATTFVPVGSYIAADVKCICLEAGTIGNDYGPGTITTLLDPLVFVVSVNNSGISNGGADGETDDQLRERAPLANNAFSAGSYDGYRYWALTAHPSIIDVSVLGPNEDPAINPGEVRLYPLVKGGGPTPQSVLDDVFATCSAKKVRGVNDTIFTASPVFVPYSVVMNIIAFNDAIDADVIANVSAAINDYGQLQMTKIGQDVVREKIISLGQVDGVYSAVPTTPAATIVVGPTQVAVIGNVTVNIISHTNG